MSIAAKHHSRNVGTSSVKVLDKNASRRYLQVQNLHASQTVRVKFGAPVAVADVTEVQTVAFVPAPTAGSFKFRWNGVDSASIDYDDNAAAIETILQAVAGLGSVTVAGSIAAGLTITMTGATPNVDPDLPLLEVVDSTLEIAAVTEVQTITAGDVPDAGSYKLGFGGEETAEIDFDATAGEVETALQALTGLGSVTVAGSFATQFTVTFTGTSGDLPLLTVIDNTLEESTNPVVLTVAESVAGVAQQDTVATVAEQTKGAYADGVRIAAGAIVTFEQGAIDDMYAAASGAGTRLELIEG